MPKKKKKAVRRKRSSSRRSTGLWLFFSLVAVVAAGILVVLLTRPLVERPIAVKLATRIGLGHGTGHGQLDSPRGIATGPDGKLYVADLGNSRIDVFNPDGSPAFDFGKKGEAPPHSLPGEFNEPSGVAVAPDGTIYVADAWNGRIQAFNPKGKPLGEFGGARYSFYSPRNVVTDAQGNIYVADTGNSMVKIYNPQGKELKVLGGKGTGNAQFDEVFGIAINAKGEIFVADPGNHRIHKFSPLPSCNFVKAIKVPGWMNGAPFWPHLACDSQGNIYAVDSQNRKLWVFNSDLHYMGTLCGQTNDILDSPLGIAFSPQGILYVGDVAGNQILELSSFTVPTTPN